MTHPSSLSLAACTACVAGLLLFGARAVAQPSGAESSRGGAGTASSGYWGYTYTPYASSSLGDAGSAVRAGAEYLRAEGDYLIKRQETNLLRLQVRERRLEVRRKELEHWKWEREFRQESIIAEQENYRKGQVEINRRFPAVAEIITAGPLNSLYDELQGRPDLPAAGSTTVEPEWLAHVHVTVSGRGNIGLLKDDKIAWPRLLLRTNFIDHHDKIEDLLDRAKKLALAPKKNQEELGEVLSGLETAVRVCEERLDQEVRTNVADPDCNPRHYIEGKRFLKQVVDVTFILEKPDAASFLAPLEGKTVAELVAYMKKNGLHFAPATVGCERSYVSLHRALADEVTRLKNSETPSNK